MSQELALKEKILIIQEELLAVSDIRTEISSKIEELKQSDKKMGTLVEAFDAHLGALKEQDQAQPALIN